MGDFGAQGENDERPLLIGQCAGCLTKDVPLLEPCPKCQPIAYCSLVCLREDAFFHGFTCATYRNFLSTRISPNQRAAFLFPHDERAPRLVWLMVTPSYTIEHTREREPDPALGGGLGGHEVQYTSTVHIGNRALPDWCHQTLQQGERYEFMVIGRSASEENQCLTHLLGHGRSEQARGGFTGDAWAVKMWDMVESDPRVPRPVVVIGGQALPCSRAELIEDVTPMDLRPIVEGLRDRLQKDREKARGAEEPGGVGASRAS